MFGLLVDEAFLLFFDRVETGKDVFRIRFS
jgi:hypothetical protein